MTPQTIGYICLGALLLFLFAFVVAWCFGQVPLQRRPESRTEQRRVEERKRKDSAE